MLENKLRAAAIARASGGSRGTFPHFTSDVPDPHTRTVGVAPTTPSTVSSAVAGDLGDCFSLISQAEKETANASDDYLLTTTTEPASGASTSVTSSSTQQQHARFIAFCFWQATRARGVAATGQTSDASVTAHCYCNTAIGGRARSRHWH